MQGGNAPAAPCKWAPAGYTFASMPFPEINASLNGLATVLLFTGYAAIRSGRRDLHQKLMAAAFLTSAVFLVTYVISKIVQGGAHTPFAGTGLWRTLYYVILISHIILAIVILPFILRVGFLAWRQRFDEHRRLARWVFPVWAYVSITGVLVYFFLFQWFP